MGNKENKTSQEQAPENSAAPEGDMPIPAVKAKKALPQEFYIPLSILIAGIMISASILISGAITGNSGQTAGALDQNDTGQDAAELAKQITPVKPDDHIRGSLTAPIKLVEYADLDCIYCKHLQDTMTQLMSQYGDKIAWVFRQFPLTSIHPSAGKKALAAECAAEQGGNDAFWKFVDEAYALQDPSTYDQEVNQIISKLGLDKSKLDACVASNKYASKISATSTEAAKAGATGTPFTIITDGKTFIPIIGAVPIEQFQSAIDSLLK